MVEGKGDTDGDGIPNYFDLDSDGDGCFDVTEAGFIDDDFYTEVYDTIVEDLLTSLENPNFGTNNQSLNQYGLLKVNGTTIDDDDDNESKRHILEIPRTFTQNYDGYTFLGEYDDHSYYESTGGSNWTSAKAQADAVPTGYLAVFTSQEELNWIRTKL